jgi:mRNA interferase RelE/StbE
MPVRVELINRAVVDLAEHAESGNLKLFLRKLVEIEEKGSQAGEPLGRNLTGWRKITVGDRDWRIVFHVDGAETVATVCVIGDREDEACYEEAGRRAKQVDDETTASLAESMLEVFGSRKERKAAKRKRVGVGSR